MKKRMCDDVRVNRDFLPHDKVLLHERLARSFVLQRHTLKELAAPDPAVPHPFLKDAYGIVRKLERHDEAAGRVLGACGTIFIYVKH